VSVGIAARSVTFLDEALMLFGQHVVEGPQTEARPVQRVEGRKDFLKRFAVRDVLTESRVEIAEDLFGLLSLARFRLRHEAIELALQIHRGRIGRDNLIIGTILLSTMSSGHENVIFDVHDFPLRK
jgi:hypothetical protein